jgi:Subtilisin inhibitor-like
MSWRALPSLLAAAALLSACGTEGGSDAGSGNSPDREPGTELRIEFQATADGEAVSATLACNPLGGEHPRAEEACTVLEENSDSLSPVSRDVACTQIYGGPETATVTGTFRGSPVHARFNRTNGCEIARWESLEPLLRLRD